MTLVNDLTESSTNPSGNSIENDPSPKIIKCLKLTTHNTGETKQIYSLFKKSKGY